MKKIVRITIEMPMEIGNWEKEEFEYYRNEGTFCSDNCIEDIKEFIEEMNKEGRCSCNSVTYEMLDYNPTEWVGSAYKFAKEEERKKIRQEEAQKIYEEYKRTGKGNVVKLVEVKETEYDNVMDANNPCDEDNSLENKEMVAHLMSQLTKRVAKELLGE